MDEVTGHKPVVRRRHEHRDPDTINQERALLENLLARVTLLENAMAQVFEDIETLTYVIFEAEVEEEPEQDGWPEDGARDEESQEPVLRTPEEGEDDAEWAAREAERLREAAAEANELDAEPGAPKGFNDVTQEDIDAQGS